jgi:hypothetical protein
MFANTQMGGTDTGFPDVCLTPAPPAPPVPMPYPNVATGPMGAPPATKILFMCAPAHNTGTTIKPTQGDELGVSTGVASGTVKGPSRHVTAAFTVLLLGQPATRLTSVTVQNSTNCPGARIVPSQTKVLLLAP